MSDSKDTVKRVQRDVLPIPDHPYAGFVAYDAKDPDSKFAPIEELRPPQGAPNIPTRSLKLSFALRFMHEIQLFWPKTTPVSLLRCFPSYDLDGGSL
jgi:hypothetical protein